MLYLKALISIHFKKIIFSWLEEVLIDVSFYNMLEMSAQ